MGAAVEEFRARAVAWLKEHAEPRPPASAGWGVGSDDVSVFHDLTEDEERELLQRLMAWQQQKYDAGYVDGLSDEELEAFQEEEASFLTPPAHETFSVTKGLVAPTVARFGTPEQRERFVRPFLRTEVLCCQLFSEPGAGSDLAGLSTSAVKDGDEWVVNGQKVWSSGARFSAWGELICRTDPTVPKHAGLTAFLLDLATPGVEVRPIRQMSGGSSFCEVFFTDVRVPDSLRLGDVGDGWNVALTTLAFERATSGNARDAEHGGSWAQVRALAEWAGVGDDPVARQALARLYTLDRLRVLNGERIAASESAPGAAPSPLHSTAKLLWTQWLSAVSDVVSGVLGPRLVADSGEWGTFAWAEHVLGAPGYRIAGGSDEIQRNIIGERVLGLPPEPRTDRGLPFNQLKRSERRAPAGWSSPGRSLAGRPTGSRR